MSPVSLIDSLSVSALDPCTATLLSLFIPDYNAQTGCSCARALSKWSERFHASIQWLCLSVGEKGRVRRRAFLYLIYVLAVALLFATLFFSSYWKESHTHIQRQDFMHNLPFHPIVLIPLGPSIETFMY